MNLPVIESERYFQCPARRGLGCGDIETRLGWRQGVPLKECNICYDLGGLYSLKDKEWRENYYRTVIDNVLSQNLKEYDPEVIVKLIEKHCTLDEGRQLLPRLATYIGEETSLRLAVRLNLVNDIQIIFASLTEDEKIDKLHYSLRWTQEVHDSFQEAEEVENWNLVEKGFFFLSAVLSGKHVDPDDLNDRYVSCFGINLNGEKVREPCKALKESKISGYFCGDCGCGDTKKANLKKKLHYKKLRCPRKKKGFYNQLTVNGNSI